MAQLRSWEVDAIHGERLEDEVFYVGTDDDDYESPAHRQHRYQQVARRYLDGHAPIILTASLRGPFESASGWSNPWAKSSKRTLTITSSAAQPTPPQSAVKPNKQRRLASASPQKPTQQPAESYLPSPESLKQAPIAEELEEEGEAEEEHPYLEDGELRMVQQWRAGVQEQANSRPENQLAGQKRKRSIDTENWLKTIPAKRTHRRKHNIRTSDNFGQQLDPNAITGSQPKDVTVGSIHGAKSSSPVSPSKRQLTIELQKKSPSRELWKREAAKPNEEKPATQPLSSPVSLKGEALQRRPVHSSPLKNVTTAPRSPTSTPCSSPKKKPCDARLTAHQLDETLSLPQEANSPTQEALDDSTATVVATGEPVLESQASTLPINDIEPTVQRAHTPELAVAQVEAMAPTNDNEEPTLECAIEPPIDSLIETTVPAPVKDAIEATDEAIVGPTIEQTVGSAVKSAAEVEETPEQTFTAELNKSLKALDCPTSIDQSIESPRFDIHVTAAYPRAPETVILPAAAETPPQKTCKLPSEGCLNVDEKHSGNEEIEEDQLSDSSSESEVDSESESDIEDDFEGPDAQLVADFEGSFVFPPFMANDPQTCSTAAIEVDALENTAAAIEDSVVEAEVELASAAMAMFLSQSSTSEENCTPDEALQRSVAMSPQNQPGEDFSFIDDSMASPETPLPSIEVPIKMEDSSCDTVQLEAPRKGATPGHSSEPTVHTDLIAMAQTAGAILGQTDTETAPLATPATAPPVAIDAKRAQEELAISTAPRPSTPTADGGQSICMAAPPLPLLPPSTPQPSFQIASFSSFMSPSPIRRRARISRCGRRSCLSVGSGIKDRWGTAARRKSVTWASVAEDNHGSRLAIREQSPPPDALLGDLPVGQSDKFAGHFSAVVRRTDGLRHKFRSMKKRNTLAEPDAAINDLSPVEAVADAMEINDNTSATEPVSTDAAVESQEATLETDMGDRDREELSMEPLDVVEDMFREMGDILQVFNVDAELDQARRVDGISG